MVGQKMHLKPLSIDSNSDKDIYTQVNSKIGISGTSKLRGQLLNALGYIFHSVDYENRVLFESMRKGKYPSQTES